MRTDDDVVEALAIVTERGFVIRTFIHVVPGERVEFGLGEFGEIEDVGGTEDRIAQLAMLAIGQQERRTREELEEAQRSLSSVQH